MMGALALAACSGTTGEQQVPNNVETPNAAASEAQAPIPPPGTGPNARTPLAEPKGPIDPKSAEAAGQVVQHYGALIEQGRWSEAAKLWSNADSASGFATELKRYPDVHLEIGSPGESEGAAGSIYVTEPVSFYGKDGNGKAFRRAANVTLRRVNDVPGSTEEQRRWHIERIEWRTGAKARSRSRRTSSRPQE